MMVPRRKIKFRERLILEHRKLFAIAACTAVILNVATFWIPEIVYLSSLANSLNSTDGFNASEDYFDNVTVEANEDFISLNNCKFLSKFIFNANNIEFLPQGLLLQRMRRILG